MTTIAFRLAVPVLAALLAGCGSLGPRSAPGRQMASVEEIPIEVLSQCQDFKKLIKACRLGDSVWWVIYRTSDAKVPKRSFGFRLTGGKWLLTKKDNSAGSYCR